MPALQAALASVSAKLRVLGEPARAAILDEAAGWLADPGLRVVLIGEVNAGKSTLANALLGKVLLKTGLRPMSSEVTCLRHGERDEVTEVSQDGGQCVRDLAELERLGTLVDGQYARRGIARLEVSLADFCRHLPNGVVLVDTPGLNDGEEQTLRAARAAVLSDLVLLMVNAEQAGTRDERSLLSQLRGELPDKQVYVVVNYMNRLGSDEERLAVRSHLEGWLWQGPVAESSGGAVTWLEVNAIAALRRGMQIASGPHEPDDFDWLLQQLDALGAQHAENFHLSASPRLAALQNTLAPLVHWNAGQLELHLSHQREEWSRKQAAIEQSRIALRRLQQLKSGEWALTSAMARQQWREGIEEIENKMEGATAADLGAHAFNWVEMEWGIRESEIRDQCRERLALLAGDAGCSAPEFDFSVPPSLHPAYVPPKIPNQLSTEKKAAIAAGVGFLFGGPVGAAIAGATVGGYSAAKDKKRKPLDESFIESARECWQTWTHHAMDLVQEEWDVAVQALETWLEAQSRPLPPPLPQPGPGMNHRHLSEALSHLQALIERELVSGSTTSRNI